MINDGEKSFLNGLNAEINHTRRLLAKLRRKLKKAEEKGDEAKVDRLIKLIAQTEGVYAKLLSLRMGYTVDGESLVELLSKLEGRVIKRFPMVVKDFVSEEISLRSRGTKDGES